jgi:hypothetical protein
MRMNQLVGNNSMCLAVLWSALRIAFCAVKIAPIVYSVPILMVIAPLNANSTKTPR